MLVLSLAAYNSALRGFENNPATVATLLAPFQITGAPVEEDEFLLVGHVLDAINQECAVNGLVHAEQVVDIIDSLMI
jgi:hypothetical protein